MELLVERNVPFTVGALLARTDNCPTIAIETARDHRLGRSARKPAEFISEIVVSHIGILTKT
jgi:hypothetical protein